MLHHLLEDSAAARPGAEALNDRGRSLTYEELDRKANRFAHLLLELGVRRGDRVGIYLDKSVEAIVAIYAVLKAGAAYVPLDASAPPARLGYVAGDCDIRHLLSGCSRAASWPELVAAGAPLEVVVTVDGEADPGGSDQVRTVGATDAAGQPDTPPAVTTTELDLAYILYTSGSTGRPKGVMLTHSNAMTFVAWGASRFSVVPSDRLSSHAPLHFDLSIFDVFVAAAAGAALVLVPPALSVFPVEIGRFIERNGITVWYSVPSVLSMVALRGGLAEGGLPSLREVLFAGEVFPTRYLRQLMELVPDAGFHNLYGPTETNVCLHHEVVRPPPGPDEAIPIGSPIAGVEVFALTGEGRRAELGEPGELLVRGATVTQGYWGDPERTAAALVPNPLTGGADDRVYRTGDLGVEQEPGVFRFLGRMDSQVKSRGYRIELGDIEAALYANPAVLECSVVAVPDELVTNRIKAYVVCRRDIDRSQLVRFCSQRIPKYMIPEVFEFRATLPRTSTGKVDRQALARETAAAVELP